MFKNYLMTTLRTISRRRGFSLLNVMGLSIGLTASLLILQYVKDEFSYDDFHANRENLYRVEYDYYREGDLVFKSATSFPKMAPTLKSDFPEVENSCRLYLIYGGTVVRYGETAIKEDNLFLADQSFLEMFSFPLVAGDRQTALSQPNTVIVEEKTAKKYFGDEDPIGKRIRTDTQQEYEVTGVIHSPENSHLKFSFLFSYKTYPGFTPSSSDPPQVNQWEEAWGWYDFYNYIQLKPGADPSNLEAKFPEYIKKYGREGDDKRIVFSLQKMTDIHLYSDLIQEARVNGNGRSVNFLMIIAFFILGIAWVNYINLSTARAVERAKEVGVRKSIGAARYQLMGQFISEAFLVNFMACLGSLALLILSIPAFNRLSGKALTMSILSDTNFWISIIVLFIIGSVLSGLYPAFILSAFKPAQVLKGAPRSSHKGLTIRQGLVVIQFMASVALIAGTLIVYQQLRFMQDRNLGISIDQILVIKGPDIVRDSIYGSAFNSFKNEMRSHPAVKNIAGSTEIPGNLVYWTNGAKRIGLDQEQPGGMIYRIGIDHDFFAAYGNEIIAGRGYSLEYTGDSASVILNRKAVTDYGYPSPDEAVGSKIRIGRDTLTIVGVIENYHQEGLKVDFRPTAFHLRVPTRNYFTVKLEAKNVEQTIAYAKEKYSALFPGNPFDYFFLDTFFNRQYKGDRQFGQIFGLFSLLAIFVASLGLFGLASYTAASRTKEIGIRKVLGSSVSSIFILLSKDFLKLVLWANVIAVPLVWLLMNKWLTTFAFRISIGIMVFLVAAFISVLIALLTVSFQSVSAALTNPVKSLRYE